MYSAYCHVVYYWEKRNKEFLLPTVFELAGRQRLTVKREIKNVGQLRPAVEGKKDIGQAICTPWPHSGERDGSPNGSPTEWGPTDVCTLWPGERDSSPKESPGKGRKRLMMGQNPTVEVAPFRQRK